MSLKPLTSQFFDLSWEMVFWNLDTFSATEPRVKCPKTDQFRICQKVQCVKVFGKVQSRVQDTISDGDLASSSIQARFSLIVFLQQSKILLTILKSKLRSNRMRLLKHIEQCRPLVARKPKLTGDFISETQDFSDACFLLRRSSAHTTTSILRKFNLPWLLWIIADVLMILQNGDRLLDEPSIRKTQYWRCALRFPGRY